MNFISRSKLLMVWSNWSIFRSKKFYCYNRIKSRRWDESKVSTFPIITRLRSFLWCAILVGDICEHIFIQYHFSKYYSDLKHISCVSILTVSEFVYNIAFNPSTRIHNQYSPDHEIDITYYHFARVKIDNVSFFSGDSIFAFLLFIMDRVINILRRQKGMLQLKVVLVLVCFVFSSAIFK